MVHRADGVPADAPLLHVQDTLRACTRSAPSRAPASTGTLVAVTGSVGKTTTKEMLRAMLAAHGATCAAEASHNNQWGLPLTLARLPRRSGVLWSPRSA